MPDFCSAQAEAEQGQTFSSTPYCFHSLLPHHCGSVHVRQAVSEGDENEVLEEGDKRPNEGLPQASLLLEKISEDQESQRGKESY